MDRTIATAFGLAAIYLFFSVVVSAIVEFIASLAALRARSLEQGLANMLTKPLADSIRSHPLLASVTSASGTRFFKWKQPPAFLHSGLFADAFLARVETLRASADRTAAELDKAYQVFVAQLGPTDSRTAAEIEQRLRGILDAVTKDARGARRAVEEWFNAGMDHVRNAYRRQAKVITRVVTLALVLALNIDAVAMTRTLWNDPVARQHALELGKVAREACAPAAATPPAPAPNAAAPAAPPADCEQLLASITDTSTSSLIMPLGWSSGRWHDAKESPWLIILGLVLSLAAIGLGAPFWYDVLRRWAPGLHEAKPPP